MLICISIFFIHQASHSQSEIIKLEQVIHIGSDSENINTELMSQQVSIIDINEESNKLTTLEDLLEKESDIQIRRFGGIGSYSSISIRGSESNQVRIFIDGAPISISGLGSFDLSNLNLQNFQTIEIYKGSAPAHFGVASIGGAINLISKKGYSDTKKMFSKINLATGSFDTYKYHFSSSLHLEKSQFYLSTTHTQSDGDFIYLDNRRTLDNPNDDIIKTRRNNDLDQKDLYINGNYSFNSDHSFDFLFNYFDKDKGLAGRSNNQATSARYIHTQHSGQLKLNSFKQNASKLNLYLGLSHTNDQFFDTYGRNGEIGLGRQDNENRLRSQYFKIYNENSFFNHSLSSSYQIKKEIYRPRDRINSLPDLDSDRIHHDLSLNYQYHFSPKNIIYSQSLNYTSQLNHFSTGNANDFSDFSFNSGLIYTPKKSIRFKLNVNRALREPSFHELFGDRGFFIGNPNLLNEISYNYDLSLDWKPQLSLSYITTHSFLTELFYQDKENSIQTLFDARGVGRASNIEGGTLSGISFSHSIEFVNRIELKQNITFNNHEITSSPYRHEINNKIPGIYENIAFFSATYFLSNFKFHYEYHHFDNMYYDRANLISAQNKRISDFGISYIKNNWSIYFELNNFTNQQIEDFNGWPAPGRHYTFSGEFSF